MIRYRIFLSSPGDVGREREVAIQVVKRLRNRYLGQIETELYLWEHEPMLASRGDFQENIPEPTEFDLVVCVLWSRLGTRLHPGRHRRPDGTAYSSGTEYEFEVALEGFRTNRRPDLLVYRRDEIPLFPASPKERRAALEQQWEGLEQFCRRWFADEDQGSIKLAFNTYRNLAQFEENLERHLHELLQAYRAKNGMISQPQEGQVQERWIGESPYRGLQVFESEHEAIFFGRTKQRDEVLGALQARLVEEGTPFVLLFGASGSGKSSLLRAGVMPWLCRPGVIDGVGLWRSMVVRPSDSTGDLLQALAGALLSAGALPEIGTDGTDALKLAALLEKNPEGLALLVKEALSRAAGEEQRRRDLLQQPVARLAIGLDQLEEVFTLAERFSIEQRIRFFKAVRAVAESGFGWVVATLRSDFFSRCEEIDDLVELKQGKGQYHLLPPNAAQLSQIIRYPAEAAGAVFEEDPEKGRLDERIRDDALREPGGLPLLEYALDELFRTGGADGVLSHAEYETLGGVEGALRKRAEDTFAGLPLLEREGLGPVLRQIVRLGSGDDETLTRRVAGYEAATAQPGARGLVEAFISARLLVADRDSTGARTLMVAHEALLRVWPEVGRWEKENRDFLRVRARLGEAMARWIECNQESDYLLAPGRPLAEAEELLQDYEASLDPEEENYIRASRAKLARAAGRRRLVITGVITVLAVVAGAAIWQWREAVVQKGSAVQSQNRAASARNSAESILNYLLNQLSDKLQPIGHLDIVEDVQKQVETYYKNLGFSERDPKALSNWAILLKLEGERLQAQGDLVGARAKFEERLHIIQKLVRSEPSNPVWGSDLSISYYRLGDVLQAQGDLKAAKAQYQSALEILHALVKQDPGNNAWQRDLSVSCNKLGDVLQAEGDLNGAKAQYQSALEISQTLVRQDSSNTVWQRDLSFTHNRLGDVLQVQGDLAGAKAQFQNGLMIVQKLADRDQGNSDWRLDLSVSYERLGDVLTAQGDLNGAQSQFQSALDIRLKLANQDPGNRVWQHALSISYNLLGDIMRAQGDLSGAKVQYQKYLEIAEMLTKQDPGNSVWQHNLLLAYKAFGILLKEQGDLNGARKNFQASLAIVTDLIRLHGENPTWEADLDSVRKELDE
jgi:eukaryotic-like serine/threonine-protein kinase